MSDSVLHRVAVGIEYLGSRYHGWQAQQAGVDTIQIRLETAIAKVAGHPVRLHCAGRTDTGVHAIEQVAHFDVSRFRPPKAWVFGANSQLPDDISIRWATDVEEGFHARYSALERTYLYLINNQKSRSALLHDRTAREHRLLDARSMHEAGQWLIGERDFTSFRAAGCQSRTPMRCVTRLTVVRRGDLVAIRISANAFLHHMVRNIAGVLMDIGAGSHPPEHAGRVLAAKDRTSAGKTAPPEGLYLAAVAYDPAWGLPSTDIDAQLRTLLNN